MMKYLQKLGKALMLPVAVLPICGLLMGIGYALCLSLIHIFVADEFHNGYFTKAVPYNWNLQNEKKADKVIIELVERHIHSLIEEAPYIDVYKRQHFQRNMGANIIR